MALAAGSEPDQIEIEYRHNYIPTTGKPWTAEQTLRDLRNVLMGAKFVDLDTYDEKGEATFPVLYNTSHIVAISQTQEGPDASS